MDHVWSEGALTPLDWSLSTGVVRIGHTKVYGQIMGWSSVVGIGGLVLSKIPFKVYTCCVRFHSLFLSR